MNSEPYKKTKNSRYSQCLRSKRKLVSPEEGTGEPCDYMFNNFPIELGGRTYNKYVTEIFQTWNLKQVTLNVAVSSHIFFSATHLLTIIKTSFG
jgi:hypothetical protein